MKAVGVKQLKTRLSEYLRMVRNGETVLVTDRDEVVAELRPANRRRHAPDSTEEILELAAERGEYTPPSIPRERGTWKIQGVTLPKGTAQKILDELREERWPLRYE